MLKTIVVILAATVFLVAAAAEVSAQDVLMNSAETINQGNFKLALFPTVLFGKNCGDSLWGVGAGAAPPRPEVPGGCPPAPPRRCHPARGGANTRLRLRSS